MEAIYLSEQLHNHGNVRSGLKVGCSLKDSSFSRLRGKDNFAVLGKKHLFLRIWER
jgi:hypothetical protein